MRQTSHRSATPVACQPLARACQTQGSRDPARRPGCRARRHPAAVSVRWWDAASRGRTPPGRKSLHLHDHRSACGLIWPAGVSLWNTVRIATRTWRRTPALATVIVGTLALGIGATTAAFTIAYSMLVQRFPFPDPDRLVWITTYDSRDRRRTCRGDRIEPAAAVRRLAAAPDVIRADRRLGWRRA